MYFHVHKTFISLQCQGNCVSEQTHTSDKPEFCKMQIHATQKIRTQAGFTALKTDDRKTDDLDKFWW